MIYINSSQVFDKFSKIFAYRDPAPAGSKIRLLAVYIRRFVRDIAILTVFSMSLCCAGNGDALWIWGMGPKIINGSGEADRINFYSFLTAPHGDPSARITTLFTFVSANNYDDVCLDEIDKCRVHHPTKVREFIADAHSRGLEVHYLDGDPVWSLSAPHNRAAVGLLSAVFEYNENSAVEERFDAIQMDVEPYVLDTSHPLSWAADTLEVWNQYLLNLRDWQSRVNRHNEKTGDNLKLGVAIPFWWQADVPPTEVDHRKIQDIVDYIAIMAYDTRSDSSGRPYVIDLVGTEIRYADDLGKGGKGNLATGHRVYVGLEAIDVTWKERESASFQRYMYPHSTSFFTRTHEEMRKTVAFVVDEFANESDPKRYFSSFAGLAYHYYEDLDVGETAFRSLRSENSNRAPVCFLTFPSGKEIISNSGDLLIEYDATDPDGDPLSIELYISDDSGVSWQPLLPEDTAGESIFINDGQYLMQTNRYPPGKAYRLMLTASETNSQGLSGFDRSDFDFEIESTRIDQRSPSAEGARISLDPDVDHPTGRFRINWTPFQDDSGIHGYFYSLADPSEPKKALFTRALSGYLTTERIGYVPVYLWAVDYSGNRSAPIRKMIQIYSDVDNDLVADIDDSDIDGDGVGNREESQNASDATDQSRYPAATRVGVWRFNDRTLENSDHLRSSLSNISGTVAFSARDHRGEDIVLDLTGVSESSPKLSFDSDITPAGYTAITVEMWIQPERDDEVVYIPLAFDGDIDLGLSFLLQNDSGNLSLRCYYSGTKVNGKFIGLNYANDSLFDGRWHHVAFSYNGIDRQITLFIDGVAVAKTSNPKIPASMTHRKTLRFFDAGSDLDIDNGVDCDLQNIDDRCVYNAYSAQFENNLYNGWDKHTKFRGRVDNIKVVCAALPPENLGFYTDYSVSLDNDNDGLNDNWEIFFFGDQSCDAFADSDQDGINNIDEFKNQTSPIEYRIHLKPGWNLISVTAVPIENSIDRLFNKYDISPSLWTWNNSAYEPAQSLESTRGYWVYSLDTALSVPIRVAPNQLDER